MNKRRSFVERLSSDWNLSAAHLFFPLSGEELLLKWISPSLVSDSSGRAVLNWSEWLPLSDVRVQERGLVEQICTRKGFLLHKLSRGGSFDAEVQEVERLEEVEEIKEFLCSQFEDVVLRDEMNGEEKPPLSEGLELLGNERRLLVKRDALGLVGIAVVGDVGNLLSRGKETLELAAERMDAKGVVCLHILLSLPNEAEGLLSHVMSLYEGFMVVLRCPVVLSCLKFYSSNGFSYSDMRSTSQDLLPSVIDRIESAVRVWCCGHPGFRYLHSDVEGRRVRIAAEESGIQRDRCKGVVHLDVEGGDVLSRFNAQCGAIWVWGVRSNDLERAFHECRHILLSDWRIDSITIIAERTTHLPEFSFEEEGVVSLPRK